MPVRRDPSPRFVTREDKVLAIREPPCPLVVNNVIGQLPGFTCSGWQEPELFGRPRTLNDDRFLVGGEGVRIPFAQPDGRGAVGPG